MALCLELTDSLYFNLFGLIFLFLVTPCLVVAVQPCMEWIPIKKKYKTFLASLKFTYGYIILSLYQKCYFLRKLINVSLDRFRNELQKRTYSNLYLLEQQFDRYLHHYQHFHHNFTLIFIILLFHYHHTQQFSYY